ncbi:MAG: Sec-independent protein translocase protein TatB [Candidatus Hydrogenedentes bacterium]|nr:Sec-independent protein translocase protein TatB [Candidatus Hydrogenedentota bacterium]
MFNNIGITEMLVIAAVALLILGPDKFPGHAKIALRFMRDIRSYWEEAKRDIAEEIKPFKKELKELEKIKPEEFIDSLTGEDESNKSSAATYGGAYSYSDTSVPASAADSSEKSEPEPAQRSESTSWERPEGSEPYNPSASTDSDNASETGKKEFYPTD